MERTFDVVTLETYPTKFTGKDIFSMTQKLTRSLVRQIIRERFSIYHIVDLYIEDLASLSNNIERYNAECM